MRSCSVCQRNTHNYCRVTFALYHRKDRFVSVKLCQKETLSYELLDCIGKPKPKWGVTTSNENLSLLNISKLSEVRENGNAQVMIGFSFLMIWLVERVARVSWTIHRAQERKPNLWISGLLGLSGCWKRTTRETHIIVQTEFYHVVKSRTRLTDAQNFRSFVLAVVVAFLLETFFRSTSSPTARLSL